MNVYFVPWDPSVSSSGTEEFDDIMKTMLGHDPSRHEGRLLTCACELPSDCAAGRDDIIFVLRSSADGCKGGVAMVAAFAEDCGQEPRQGFKVSRVLPLYLFQTESYDALRAADLAAAIPEIDWEGLDAAVRLDGRQEAKAIDLWLDFVVAHFDSFSTVGGRARKPKALTLLRPASMLCFSQDIYPHLYRRYRHVCDICGFDFDYVYGRLDYVPQLLYLASLRKGVAPKSPDYRSVICICENCRPVCRPYVKGGLPLDELRAAVRPVSCDVPTIAMQVKLTPDRLLS